MKRLILIIFPLLPLILLVACGPQAGGVKVIPSPPVKVFVSTPCVTKDQIPAEPEKTGPLPDDARVAADLVGAKAGELRLWGEKMSALLQGCVK